MDSNSIFSGFAKKRQQAFLAPLMGKTIENAKASSIGINIDYIISIGSHSLNRLILLFSSSFYMERKQDSV